MWNKLDRAVIGLLDWLLEIRMMPVFLILLWFVGIVSVIVLAGKVIGG